MKCGKGTDQEEDDEEQGGGSGGGTGGGSGGGTGGGGSGGDIPPTTDKTLKNVEFDGNRFNEGIWEYAIMMDTKKLNVTLKAGAFSEDNTSVTLGYDDMPYEKLIDTNDNEYLTVSYITMFKTLPETVKTLTIDNWTNRTILDMRSMFADCYALTELSLGAKFDTSSVTDMRGMFANCYALTELSLGAKFDTSSVTDMNSMFANCYALTELSLGNNFNTRNVTDMNKMFSSCWALTTLSLGDKFNTSNVTSMNDMFSGCMALTSIPLYETSESIVKALPLATWTVTDNNSDDVDTVTVSEESSVTWNQGEPAQWTNPPWTFSNPAKILNDGTFTGNTFTKDLWTYTITGTNVGVKLNGDAFNAQFSTATSVTLGYEHMPYEKLMKSGDTTEYLIVSYEGMFSELLPTTLKTLTIDNWTNRNVTDMAELFTSCEDIASLNLGNNFNTSKVTDMRSIFSNCYALTTLSLRANFNTSSVTDMRNMFARCDALTSLSLGTSFNTSAVTNIAAVFFGSGALNSVTLYQSSSSIIKELPSATWTVKNNRSDEVNKVTVSEGVSASWTYDEPTTWTNTPWTLSRNIQSQ